ncbi:hypothetical protein DH86_00001558, partial [Scytalidium sp. 3C]
RSLALCPGKSSGRSARIILRLYAGVRTGLAAAVMYRTRAGAQRRQAIIWPKSHMRFPSRLPLPKPLASQAFSSGSIALLPRSRSRQGASASFDVSARPKLNLLQPRGKVWQRRVGRCGVVSPSTTISPFVERNTFASHFSSRRYFSSTPPAMTATKIDGTAIAKSIRERLHAEIDAAQRSNPRYKPSLKIIQATYVRMKLKAAAEAGINCELLPFPEETTEAELVESITRLNNDPE